MCFYFSLDLSVGFSRYYVMVTDKSNTGGPQLIFNNTASFPITVKVDEISVTAIGMSWVIGMHVHTSFTKRKKEIALLLAYLLILQRPKIDCLS